MCAIFGPIFEPWAIWWQFSILFFGGSRFCWAVVVFLCWCFGVVVVACFAVACFVVVFVLLLFAVCCCCVLLLLLLLFYLSCLFFIFYILLLLFPRQRSRWRKWKRGREKRRRATGRTRIKIRRWRKIIRIIRWWWWWWWWSREAEQRNPQKGRTQTNHKTRKLEQSISMVGLNQTNKNVYLFVFCFSSFFLPFVVLSLFIFYFLYPLFCFKVKEQDCLLFCCFAFVVWAMSKERTTKKTIKPLFYSVFVCVVVFTGFGHANFEREK